MAPPKVLVTPNILAISPIDMKIAKISGAAASIRSCTSLARTKPYIRSIAVPIYWNCYRPDVWFCPCKRCAASDTCCCAADLCDLHVDWAYSEDIWCDKDFWWSHDSFRAWNWNFIPAPCNNELWFYRL